MDELKPCPFCGTKSYECDCVVFNNNLGGKWYFVECIECKAQGPRMTTHKHACEAWNRRTNGK